MSSLGLPFLERLQRWMQAVIVHPGGVAAGMGSEEARGELDVTASELERVIGRSRALTAAERLQVYNNAYFARLLECLEAEFPAVRQAVGEKTFSTLVCGYLQSYPSRSYTLSDLGRRLPVYLHEIRPDTAANALADWADFVIDLARLERLYAEVFDGPGSEGRPMLAADQLLGISPEEWPRVRLRCVPCLRLEEFRFPVHEYATAARVRQTAHDAAPPLAVPSPCETFLVVTRRDFVVRRFAATADEFKALRLLHAGRPVGEVVRQSFDSGHAAVEELAGRLENWFRRWAAARLFEAVEREC